jgi:hypothetical protein
VRLSEIRGSGVADAVSRQYRAKEDSVLAFVSRAMYLQKVPPCLICDSCVFRASGDRHDQS